MKMKVKEVTDLYEAAYLIVNGCNLLGVSCIPLSLSLACRFSFSGENLNSLEEVYYQKEACVNLHAFRSAYSQVNSYMHEAKKSYDRQQRQQKKLGGRI
jgi:hypothetical protein